MNIFTLLTIRCREALVELKVRLGSFQPPRGTSILICTNRTPSDWIKRFIVTFGESNPRENIFLINGGIPNLPLSGGESMPYPAPVWGVKRRFLRRLRARIILVDEGVKPPRKLLLFAVLNDISVAYLEKPNEHNEIGQMHMCSSDQSDSTSVLSGLKDYAGEESTAALAPLMAREMKPHLDLKKRIKLLFWERTSRTFYTNRFFQLSSFSDIKASMGHPKTILCLGNGPSSEDPQISGMNHDVTFRVNHRWLGRGLNTEPDAIFTGALDSVLAFGKDVLYVFMDRERAKRIVRKASKRIKGLKFANAEELGFPIEQFHPYQATNGLVMIYVAVHLRPNKLTIAGIDLYSDPRGCYPGETSTPNVYTSGHNAIHELKFMLSILASFKGQLTIVGDRLKLEYERYISEQRSQS